MCYDFRVIKKQQVRKKKGDVSTSIQFDYNYSSEGLIQQILRIDLKDVTAIREVFPNLDASITIRTIPKHVLGFSTDWSAVIKKINWFSFLPKPKQKEEQKDHSQLPRFERKIYETNIKFLIEQQELLKSTAASSSSVVASSLASSVTPTKVAVNTKASSSSSSSSSKTKTTSTINSRSKTKKGRSDATAVAATTTTTTAAAVDVGGTITSQQQNQS